MAASKYHPRVKGFRVAVEPLEARLVFSTLTVNTLLDNTTADSLLTLRESAMLIQHNGDASAALGRALTAGEQAQVDTAGGYATNTVVFDDALAGGTITLGSQIDFTASMTIDGGGNRVTLSGGATPGTHRAFFLDGLSHDFASLTLNNLILKDFGYTGASGEVFGQNAEGGAIWGYYATVAINNCTFTNNVVIGGDAARFGGEGRGGAIWLYSSTLSIDNSTFSNNTAQGGIGSSWSGLANAGAVHTYDATLTITNSTFTGNTTVSRDRYGWGGAIYAYDTDATLNFVTISGNEAETEANGLYHHGDQDLSITNSILGQADASKPDLMSLSTGTVSGSNNLIRNTTLTGMGIVSTADPMLAALAGNGGATQTMALLPGSPAIDAGGATGVTSDQRGRQRVTGANADLGAFEVGNAPPYISGVNTISRYVGAINVTWGSSAFPTAAMGYTGTLPTGLTFTDNGDGTASLTGTTNALAAGTYQFQVTASNGTTPDASIDVSLTLLQRPPTTITAGAGGATTVTNPDGTEKFSIANPFPGNVTARRVANGDVNGDGTDDIIVASGPGRRGTVIAYNGNDGTQLAEFSPFEAWTGAIFIASGDVDNDGTADIVVGTGSTRWSRARVRVFSGGDFSLMSEFVAFNAASTVRVATADLDGDGYAEVIATRGAGAIAKVRVFDGQSIAAETATMASEFIAHSNWAGGCFVATGDINSDGQIDIVVSQDTTARPYVSVFNGGDNSLQKRFSVVAFHGAPIAARDMNGDGYHDILIAVKLGNRNALQVFSGSDDSILETLESDVRGRLFIA